MDILHQNILLAMRSNIVADLDIYNGVIQLLKSEYILTDQDIANIEKGASKQEKAEILLDTLPGYKFWIVDLYAYREIFLKTTYKFIFSLENNYSFQVQVSVLCM